ncbi:MAG: VIT and VWA domain-containing protein [Fimbriimonadales bacterium]|nr:VIT and VWA domain-containing protein [Fimbriimonadales bacterium]
MQRLITAGLMGCVLFAALSAQGLLIVPPDAVPEDRRILFLEHRPILLKEHTVRVVIRDNLAETTIEQLFVNESPVSLEAEYWFPVPRDAAVSGLTMTVDDRAVEAKLLSADEARRIYESFVRRQQDPALLEFVGHNLLRLRVFPVPANGSRRITLRYAQTLPREGALVHYHLPLRATRAAARPVERVRVEVEAQTRQPLTSFYSPSHPEVWVQRPAPNRARMQWEAQNLMLERDLHLYFSATADPYDLQLFTYRAGDEGYFMAMFAPNPEQRAERLPKHLVFVLDRTGSMAGEKIEQAKEAFKYCLNNLQPNDKFNLIVFSEQATPLFEGLMPATRENIQRALQRVESLQAQGGTNIYEALRVAFQSLPVERTPALRAIVFLTDGLPTVGERDPEQILKMTRERNARRAIRMFNFGVGYDVNVYLLDRLAQEHRGVSDYVRPEENIEAKVSRFYDRISLPLLTDLRLRIEGVETYEVYPTELPDLFAGDQLIVVGRYRGSGRATVFLDGQEHNRKAQLNRTFDFPAHSEEMDFLPRLWAVRKIGYLLNQWRLYRNEKVREEIVRLAHEYGIVTQFTAFLIDEDMIMARGSVRLNRALSAPGGFGGAPDTGRTAVDQSLTTSQLSYGWASPAPPLQANTAQEALQLGAFALNDPQQAERAAQRMRNLSERTFYRKGTQWIDSRYNAEEKLPVIEVAAFSDAYFRLLERLPRLRPYLTLGNEVILRLEKVVIQIGKHGKTTLTDAEWKKIRGET